MQGLTSDVCGQYYCLFVLFMDRGYTPLQFLTLFACSSNADLQVTQMFASEFRPTYRVAAGVNDAEAAYKWWVISKIPSFLV